MRPQRAIGRDRLRHEFCPGAPPTLVSVPVMTGAFAQSKALHLSKTRGDDIKARGLVLPVFRNFSTNMCRPGQEKAHAADPSIGCRPRSP